MAYEFEDYDELVIRFDSDEDKEMILRFGKKSNWSIFFRGELYSCGSSDLYTTKEFNLKELFNAVNNLEKIYNTAKKDAKSELENEFRRKNIKLISDNKKMKKELEKILAITTKLKEENQTLKDTIKLVK